MPLTSQLVEVVIAEFPDAPVIVDGKIHDQNVVYHLERAYKLFGFLADELTSHLKCDEDCDELEDEAVIAAYESWWEIAGEAQPVLDEAWRFNRKARELMDTLGEILHPIGQPEAAERLAAIKKLSSFIDRGAFDAAPPSSTPDGGAADEPDEPDEDGETEFVVEAE